MDALKDKKEDTVFNAKKQSGQTLVEFILLLASIAIISFGFMRAVNTGIERKWKAAAQLILDDKSQKLELR